MALRSMSRTNCRPRMSRMPPITIVTRVHHGAAELGNGAEGIYAARADKPVQSEDDERDRGENEKHEAQRGQRATENGERGVHKSNTGFGVRLGQGRPSQSSPAFGIGRTTFAGLPTMIEFAG